MLIDREKLKNCNKTLIANHLGISRQALYLKIKGKVRFHEREIEIINSLLESEK